MYPNPRLTIQAAGYRRKTGRNESAIGANLSGGFRIEAGAAADILCPSFRTVS